MEVSENFGAGFVDEAKKAEVMDGFMNGFAECYINLDQHQFLPYTHGLSSKISPENYTNVLLVIKYDNYQEAEILKLLYPEDLGELGIELILTMTCAYDSKEFKEIGDKLMANDNDDLNLYVNKSTQNSFKTSLRSAKLDTSNSKNTKEPTKEQSKSQRKLQQNAEFFEGTNKFELTNPLNTGENFFGNGMKFLKKGEFLLLWLATGEINGENIANYVYENFDNLCFISKEEIGMEEEKFKEFLLRIFSIKI